MCAFIFLEQVDVFHDEGKAIISEGSFLIHFVTNISIGRGLHKSAHTFSVGFVFLDSLTPCSSSVSVLQFVFGFQVELL